QLDRVLSLRCNPDLRAVAVARQKALDELQNFREILQNLTGPRVDFIHRFLRLSRATRWLIDELDILLLALHDGGLVDAQLAHAVRYDHRPEDAAAARGPWHQRDGASSPARPAQGRAPVRHRRRLHARPRTAVASLPPRAGRPCSAAVRRGPDPGVGAPLPIRE